MEGGVEQRGVHAESVGLGRGVLRQGDLGEHFPVAPPQRAQPAEQRTVSEAELRQPLVVPLDRDGPGGGGRPLRQVVLTGAGPRGRVRGGRGVRGEHSDGVHRPGLVGAGAVRPRVDPHRPAPGVVGRGHGDLELDGALDGQCQRSLEGQFLHPLAAGLVAGADREVHQRRTGQQHRPHDPVLRQPGLCRRREPPGEDEALAVGETDGGAQQGWSAERSPALVRSPAAGRFSSQ